MLDGGAFEHSVSDFSERVLRALGCTNQKRAQHVTADCTRNMSASVTWLKIQSISSP
jgi:hypothetical protein